MCDVKDSVDIDTLIDSLENFGQSFLQHKKIYDGMPSTKESEPREQAYMCINNSNTTIAQQQL